MLRPQRVAIDAARPADDSALVIAGVAGGLAPGSFAGHRPLDREPAAVAVSDDQVERLTWRRVEHRSFYFSIAMMGFLRDDLPTNWISYCDRVTDNFRVIDPKTTRIIGCGV